MEGVVQDYTSSAQHLPQLGICLHVWGILAIIHEKCYRNDKAYVSGLISHTWLSVL